VESPGHNNRNGFKRSESEFDTNKTNLFLSISIHFRLLGLKVTNYFSNALI